MMEQRDTILIVDDDPEERALLREQVFAADNYFVLEAKDGADALMMVRDQRPDLVVLDLELAGLSGQDILVAFKAQGYQGPLIVLANNYHERPVVETFRLGATDYVVRPFRETEVMAAVDRGLEGVHLRRQRDRLVHQLRNANRDLEFRVNELTTLYEIGQSVTAMHELDGLFAHVLQGALSVTRADHAMLILRDDHSGKMILRGGKNLQMALLDRVGEPLDDKLAEMVMVSRETLAVSGEGLRRFSLARDLFAVAYAPLTVQTTAIGVLAVGNHKSQAQFGENDTRMLSALANYAAIAIVNARLFHMLEQRAKSKETAYQEIREQEAQLQKLLGRLHQPLVDIESDVSRLIQGSAGKLPKDASQQLSDIDQKIRQLATAISGLTRRQDPPRS